jgi:hypothetical protein
MTCLAMPEIAVTRRQLHHARGHDRGLYLQTAIDYHSRYTWSGSIQTSFRGPPCN